MRIRVPAYTRCVYAPSSPSLREHRHLARQWLTGRYRRRESSLETVYCAELVATTYQQMGLLPKRRPASWYDPGRFWSGDRIEMVPPFALAAELAVAQPQPPASTTS